MTRSDVLLLAPQDDVAVALRDLASGERVDAAGADVVLRARVPRGHKLAVHPVPAGGIVRKYGQVIGVATRPIEPGDHVHTHNLGIAEVARDYEFGTRRMSPRPASGRPRSFAGYRRANGSAGTRNYVGILTSVNCSASTARLIADQFRGSALVDFPGVDGVMALTHTTGCGLVPSSEGGRILLRTLRGYARHPNFGGLLVLGLGCEMVSVDALVAEAGIPSDTLVRRLLIQEEGGIRATVRAGVEAIRGMLPELDRRTRVPIGIDELVLGLNCGGSDGYSGITANPALGVASDLLVAAGGTSVLAETPEVFGAEHLLTQRAASREVGERLLGRLDWWREYARNGGGSLDNNPSPGNKAGGLTTILEKSLGAVAKAGTAELSAVYEYAEPVRTRGLAFMDTPGYDPVSVTGLIAGGASVVCFTTGRGSVLGGKPAPVLKIATNSATFTRMREDMDLNAGEIADGAASVSDVGAQILDRIIEVASGARTVSEELDLGQDEFVPWHVGVVT